MSHQRVFETLSIKMVAHPPSNRFHQTHASHNRDLTTTQTALLIAASFRTWRGS